MSLLHTSSSYVSFPKGNAKTKGKEKDVKMASFSALLYASIAIAMNFVNKATLMDFHLSNVILLCQMIAAIFIVVPLWSFGYVHFPRISLTKCATLLPVTLLYNANTATALMGLSTLNIPVYSTVKRLTPMIVLTAKAVMTRRAPPRPILLSVLMVVIGCITAGAGDLGFDTSGYLFALASCSLQAAYLILVEQTGAEKGITSAELLLYNSLLSTPFLLVLVALTGEIHRVKSEFTVALSHNRFFPILFLVCCTIGCLLNFSLFLCTMNNSALTTTIVGVLKGVVVTLLGFFLLGGVQFSVLNVVGISMNTIGGVLYSFIKNNREGEQNKDEILLLSHGKENGDVESQA